MKKCCTFFEDLLPYIISDLILSAASVISQNLIIQEVPWQKSHPQHLTRWRTCHLVNTDCEELQNMGLGTTPHVITFLPNVGRFSDFGAQRQHGIQIILFFNLQKENRLKVHKQSICGWSVVHCIRNIESQRPQTTGPQAKFHYCQNNNMGKWKSMPPRKCMSGIPIRSYVITNNSH